MLIANVAFQKIFLKIYHFSEVISIVLLQKMGFNLFKSGSEEDRRSLMVPNKSFKERNSFSERVAAVQGIRDKFPNKVPVIVERFKKVHCNI